MLSTIPIYIALTDFGIGTAAGVEMTRHLERGDDTAANRVYQSGWVFLTLISFLSGATVWVGIGIWHKYDATMYDMQVAAGLMVAASILTLQVFVLRAVFTATHNFAKGQFVNDLAIPIEGLGVVIVAWSGGV
ncbi:hypothetical protein [Gemmobacter sp. 24YEA27]|uniref:hypothetical protein n=1 Tax=Gemmobacter sp. 24YEA27 TaxID=3040672 RepID=UPI0024B38E86|nr:hypothetical protein [Gemmobacter sp. 24YEA27]